MNNSIQSRSACSLLLNPSIMPNIQSIFLTALVILPASLSFAMSPDELQQKIVSGDKLTIIDARSEAMFLVEHINNAINIPASIVAQKKLPPLGQVIVYGDGIDESIIQLVVEQLNSKNGIKAESLDGGFPAWSANRSVNHNQSGLSAAQDFYISFQQLKKLTDEQQDVRLIDLRKSQAKQSLLSDFNIEPLVVSETADSTKATAEILASVTINNLQLLVLIGDGNTFAETVATQLQTAGVKRLRVLTGGKNALDTKGKSVELITVDGVVRE